MTKKIIACIDGSSSSAAVCDAAAWLSGSVSSPISLLHVIDKEGYVTESNLTGAIGLGSREHLLEELVELDAKRSKLAMQQGKLMLEAAAQRVEGDGATVSEVRQRHGQLVDTLGELDAEVAILVMGREGAEATKHPNSHIGSHLEHVIRTMQHPVLVALPPFTKPSKVVIALDGSETSKKMLTMLNQNSLLDGLKCHLVTVGEQLDDTELATYTQQFVKRGIAHKVQRLEGEVVDALLDYVAQEGIEMIAMGAYGQSRIRQFILGSTTTKLIGESPVPLLILR
uniref:universal stress protein n=1 Tax=Thaumasiovibrio occultus TaxID=1891184 RepID=UPI000B35BD03|nr:universal stress protein [Thaumasiovibrio occultus]